MIQITLERLLAGIALSLRETVAPAVSDPYARTQALTAANLIDNIAMRVDWQPGLLHAELDRLEPVLDEAERRAQGPAREQIHAARGLPTAALPARRGAALEALGLVQEWLAQAGDDADPALARDVAAFIAWQLDDQSSRLRS